MAVLTLSGPIGYKGGAAQVSGPFVGYVDSSNYVLRYSFKTPSNGYITAITFATTFRHYSGDSNTTFNVRAKITESATSHKDAGPSTTDYDATISMSGTGNHDKSCTIDGLWLKPNTTYYLYLFPGTQYFLKYCYDNEGADLSSLSYEAIVATYELSISAGTGVSISVKRTSSPSGYTGLLSDGATIYFGDVLKVTFTASTGYNILTHTLNGSSFKSGDSHTVESGVLIVSTASLKTFSLSINAGVGTSVLVKRSGVSLGNGATISYGDVLTITFSAKVGYDIGSCKVNGSVFASGGTHTVKSNVEVTSVATVKSFSLSVKPGNGSTITVLRTKSPLQGAGSGKLVNGDTIYYNDVLEISFDSSNLYEILTSTVNGKNFATGGTHTVTGNVLIVTTTQILGFVYLTVEGVSKKYRIVIYHKRKWIKYRPVILHSGSKISAIGVEDSIVVSTSLLVSKNEDTIIIGGD